MWVDGSVVGLSEVRVRHQASGGRVMDVCRGGRDGPAHAGRPVPGGILLFRWRRIRTAAPPSRARPRDDIKHRKATKERAGRAVHGAERAPGKCSPYGDAWFAEGIPRVSDRVPGLATPPTIQLLTGWWKGRICVDSGRRTRRGFLKPGRRRRLEIPAGGRPFSAHCCPSVVFSLSYLLELLLDCAWGVTRHEQQDVQDSQYADWGIAS